MSTALTTAEHSADAPKPAVAFVAVNFIHCESDYVERFETLFRSRAHAIDRIPGFVSMRVLKPQAPGGDYLVVSEWSAREAFDGWRQSPEFLEGHKRGFEDVRRAREEGRTPPMTSRFETYSVLCD
ncbi:MAG: antibiotic biosynthesis monooxygenase [Candidatus Eisenbacteria bacterium]